MAATDVTEPGTGRAPVSVIPAELRERPQWVCWRYETRDGKPTKVPYTPGGGAASTTDEAMWSSFESCSTAEGFAGVGYVFAAGDPYAGVDFDDCLDGGRLDPHVATHLLMLDSYTEVSPSGRGVKAIVKAAKTTDRCRTSRTPWGGEFEVYDRDRYFAITGHHLRGTPTTIEPRQTELEGVLAYVFPKPEARVAYTNGGGVLDADDETLLERARTAANGDKFGLLWVSDTTGYGSESEADLGLVSLLAFWTGPDPARIDRLFRRSGLMRDKWERDDYRARTIAKALERGEFFSGGDERDGVEYLERIAGKNASPTTPADATPTDERLRLRPLGSYEARAVEWLVPGHVPVGTLSLVSGVGGLNKTTLALGWAARLSAGELGRAGDTIFISLEDTAEEVLLPRVAAVGGDVDRIHLVEFPDGIQQVSLPRDLEDLRRLAKSVRARLLVVDPIMAALDLRVDSHKDQHVRVVLAQLRAIAEELRAAVVNISHLNKAPTTDAYLRIGGSPAFWNASRSVVLVTEDQTDPDVYRLVAQRKANLARIVPVERWRVEEVVHSTDRFGNEVRVPLLRFVEIADDIDRNDVLGPRAPTKRESAEAWLAGTLSHGEWHEVSALRDAAGTIGYSRATLERAADEIGVEKRKTETFPSRSQWRLITHSSAAHSSTLLPKTEECVETAQPSRATASDLPPHSSGSDGGV